MDAGTYISKRIAGLRDRSDELYEEKPGVANEFNSWSALKLILHAATVNMYTSVHANQGTGDTFYIDALAGSGVSEYDENRYFIGSGLIACREAVEPFSKMYFIENNERYKSALENRLERAFSYPEYTEPDSWMVIRGDANTIISDVVDEIRELADYGSTFNYYCFIDNQGMDVNWDFVEEITPTPYGDLLINLPTAHAVGRNVGTDAANEFFGVNLETVDTSYRVREKLLDLYSERLARRNRAIQSSTKVRANVGSFYYDLIFATRKTGGNNGYVAVIDYVKKFIESVHAGHVDNILEVLDGDQSALTTYLPESDIEDELPTTGEEDEMQSGLDDFS